MFVSRGLADSFAKSGVDAGTCDEGSLKNDLNIIVQNNVPK